MKRIPLFLVQVITSSCIALGSHAAPAVSSPSTAAFPFAVPFELGATEFAPGDSITIQAVRGTRPAITNGESVCATGTYTLGSRAEADLSFFVTTSQGGATAVDPRQTIRVQKGTGTFTLIKTMDCAGYPHLSFYPAAGGSAFGGVYFGQGAWVLQQAEFSSVRSSTGAGESPQSRSGGSGASGSSADPNRRLIEYLGDAVPAPAELDRAYTKEGLVTAVGLAARKAGITLKRVEVDDSEFPFIVGILYEEADHGPLVQQFKKMPAYEEQGGVSSKTCYVLNLTPYRVFPREASVHIGRRLTVRERMFYEQLNRQQ